MRFFVASVSCFRVLVLLMCMQAACVQAQLKCTMPNGVTITQQLGGCPRGAVSATKLDGTPVSLGQPQAPPKVQAPQPGGNVASPAASAPPRSHSAESSGLSFFGWVVVVALAYGLFKAMKGSGGKSGPVMFCTSCGTKGQGLTKTRGSLLIEIVLWLSFLVPGLIYSIWRLGSKHKVCSACGAQSLVPLNSPVARGALHVSAASGAGSSEKFPDEAPGEADAWEGSFYDVPEQRSVNRRVRIVYRDGQGQLSERVVDVRAFEPAGRDGLVIGRCHLRKATRTFRFDRMVRVVDEETGEILPDLQAALNEQWAASPVPVLDKLFAEHRDILKLLLFAAKADGAMRAAEVAVISRHCVSLTGDDRITDAAVKELLSMLDVPSVTSFARIYNQLRRERPSDAQAVAQACREIVGTQKSIHPAEQAMLDVLDKPLPAVRTTNGRGGA